MRESREAVDANGPTTLEQFNSLSENVPQMAVDYNAAAAAAAATPLMEELPPRQSIDSDRIRLSILKIATSNAA